LRDKVQHLTEENLKLESEFLRLTGVAAPSPSERGRRASAASIISMASAHSHMNSKAGEAWREQEYRRNTPVRYNILPDHDWRSEEQQRNQGMRYGLLESETGFTEAQRAHADWDQAENEALRDRLASLKAENHSLKSRCDSLENALIAMEDHALATMGTIGIPEPNRTEPSVVGVMRGELEQLKRTAARLRFERNEAIETIDSLRVLDSEIMMMKAKRGGTVGTGKKSPSMTRREEVWERANRRAQVTPTKRRQGGKGGAEASPGRRRRRQDQDQDQDQPLERGGDGVEASPGKRRELRREDMPKVQDQDRVQRRELRREDMPTSLVGLGEFRGQFKSKHGANVQVQDQDRVQRKQPPSGSLSRYASPSHIKSKNDDATRSVTPTLPRVPSSMMENQDDDFNSVTSMVHDSTRQERITVLEWGSKGEAFESQGNNQDQGQDDTVRQDRLQDQDQDQDGTSLKGLGPSERAQTLEAIQHVKDLALRIEAVESARDNRLHELEDKLDVSLQDQDQDQDGTSLKLEDKLDVSSKDRANVMRDLLHPIVPIVDVTSRETHLQAHRRIVSKWRKAERKAEAFNAVIDLHQYVHDFWPMPVEEALSLCSMPESESVGWEWTAVEWREKGFLHMKIHPRLHVHQGFNNPLDLNESFDENESEIGAVVTSCHQAVSHIPGLKVGAIIGSINGEVVLRKEYAAIMATLKKGDRPLVIQFLSPLHLSDAARNGPTVPEIPDNNTTAAEDSASLPLLDFFAEDTNGAGIPRDSHQNSSQDAALRAKIAALSERVNPSRDQDHQDQDENGAFALRDRVRAQLSAKKSALDKADMEKAALAAAVVSPATTGISPATGLSPATSISPAKSLETDKSPLRDRVRAQLETKRAQNKAQSEEVEVAAVLPPSSSDVSPVVSPPVSPPPVDLEALEAEEKLIGQIQIELAALQEKVLIMTKKDPERKKTKAQIKKLEAELGKRVDGYKSAHASALATPGTDVPGSLSPKRK